MPTAHALIDSAASRLSLVLRRCLCSAERLFAIRRAMPSLHAMPILFDTRYASFFPQRGVSAMMAPVDILLRHALFARRYPPLPIRYMSRLFYALFVLCSRRERRCFTRLRSYARKDAQKACDVVFQRLCAVDAMMFHAIADTPPC